jgi:hypothetical protein
MHRRLHLSSLRILGVCAAVILIAVIAIAADKVSTPHVTPTESVMDSTKISIAAVVSALGSKLPSDYSFLRAETPAAQTTVGFRLPGDSFQVVLPVSSPSIAYGDSRTDNEQTTYNDFNKVAISINNYLGNHDFMLVTSEDQTSGLLSAIYFYKRPDAICQVAIYANLSLTCSPLSQLTAMATQAQPLVAVYSVAAPSSGTPGIAAPNIRASKTPGYTIATLSIYNDHGETSANFYKQGSGAWHIVNLGWYNDPHEDADIIPNCADFESYTPVREAFAGQTCYDSAARVTRAISG